MAAIETVTLPHLLEHPLYVALFKDVKNAPFLRQQLLDGNAEFEYAFLDAQVVGSTSGHMCSSKCLNYAGSFTNAIICSLL